METITCQNCGKVFDTYLPPSYLKEGRGKVCSRQCAGKQSAKLTEADIPQIIELASDLSISTPDIAAKFNCSTTTIRKVLRKAGCSRGKSRSGPLNGMYGRTHTPEARAKIRAANQRQWSQPGARERHAMLTAQQIADGRTGQTHNELETAFAHILDSLELDYIWQFKVSFFVFDFFLPAPNVLIEVNGTFWHTDPRFYQRNNLHYIQRKNMLNDQKKARHARRREYHLVHFWKHDIHNRPDYVKQQLLRYLAALP